MANPSGGRPDRHALNPYEGAPARPDAATVLDSLNQILRELADIPAAPVDPGEPGEIPAPPVNPAPVVALRPEAMPEARTTDGPELEDVLPAPAAASEAPSPAEVPASRRRIAGFALAVGIALAACVGLLIVRGTGEVPSDEVAADSSADAAAPSTGALPASAPAPEIAGRADEDAAVAPAGPSGAPPPAPAAPPESPLRAVPSANAATTPAIATVQPPADAAPPASAAAGPAIAPTKPPPVETSLTAPANSAAAPAQPSLAQPSASAAMPPPPSDPSAAKALRDRGDAALAKGDIAAARLFYRSAADKGDAAAALRLGNSYDPAFLARLGVLGMRGDAAEAASWYRRARQLGDPDADRALATLPH